LGYKGIDLKDSEKITRYKLVKKAIEDNSIETIQQFFLNVERKDIIQDTSIKETRLRRRIANLGKITLDEIEEISKAMGSAEETEFIKFVLFLRSANKAQKEIKKKKGRK